MSQLEIDKILTVSSSHISESTAAKIDEQGLALSQGHFVSWAPSFTRKFGWIFCIHEGVADYADAPIDLRQLVGIAHENGCSWLMLDCDGPLVDGVLTFTW